MKKYILTLVTLFTFISNINAIPYSQAREEALYLTDKMAYELNLSESQYEAAYEINLDYFLSLDDVDDVYAYSWRQRNADFQYIMHDWQYAAFQAASYFFRPVYWNSGYWHFGIYAHYPHRDVFFFDRPVCYTTYRGGHTWRDNGGRSYYMHRADTYRGGSRFIGMREGRLHGYREVARQGYRAGERQGYREGVRDGMSIRGNNNSGYRGNNGSSYRGNNSSSYHGNNSSSYRNNGDTYRRSSTHTTVERNTPSTSQRNSSSYSPAQRGGSSSSSYNRGNSSSSYSPAQRGGSSSSSYSRGGSQGSTQQGGGTWRSGASQSTRGGGVPDGASRGGARR